MSEPKGLGHKFATRTLAEQLEWPLQQTLWDLIADLARKRRVKSIDYLQVFELEPAGCDMHGCKQRIVHRQEQPPYEATHEVHATAPLSAKIFVHIDEDSDTATMMFANEW